jgi:hypothetical protein
MKNQVKSLLQDYIMDYYSNSITASKLIETCISPYNTINSVQDEKIHEILIKSNIDWNNAPCDSEGATAEQDLFMDGIIYICIKDILKVIY